MRHSLVDLVTRAGDRYYRCHSIVGGVPTNHKEKHHVDNVQEGWADLCDCRDCRSAERSAYIGRTFGNIRRHGGVC
jgi:hypothetical protein